VTPSRSHIVAAAFLLVLFGWIAGRTYKRATAQQIAELHGVRLGMTIPQAKAGFDLGPKGQWSVAAGCEGGSLDWKPEDAASTSVRWARFEVHDGVVVALRLRLAPDDPNAGGERLQTSDDAVAARETLGEGEVAVALLDRRCLEHAPEVSQLLAGGPMRR